MRIRAMSVKIYMYIPNFFVGVLSRVSPFYHRHYNIFRGHEGQLLCYAFGDNRFIDNETRTDVVELIFCRVSEIALSLRSKMV